MQDGEAKEDSVQLRPADVFISYSHRDALWAERIAVSLREHAKYPDLNIWVDGDIRPGANWEQEILHALGTAKVALPLVSQAWKDSVYCKRELERIVERQKDPNFRVIWVSIDGSASPDLQGVQSPAPETAPLNRLDGLNAIEPKIRAICEAVFEAFDPLWNRLQAHLPAKYQLIRRLGMGSTSVVYLAGDRSLERRVAIRAVRDAAFKDAFDGAVHQAAQVARHPVLPTVFGAWLSKDPHCCVVDYIEGRTLRAHLEETRKDGLRFDARDVIRLLTRLAEALIHMHARGIQLRDLRPSKIIMGQNGDAFIAGLSKPDNAIGMAVFGRLGAAQRKRTREEASYLVPEHFYPIGGDEPRDQSDQYLLGLIGYEMLTGALPPTVPNLDDLCSNAAQVLPKFCALAALRCRSDDVPGCPRILSDLLERMTSISPRDRYEHLSEVLVILRDLHPIDLTLARESYARCMERGAPFFEEFYRRLRTTVGQANVHFEKLDGAHRWARLHELLKEAILLLFAYAATPLSGRHEPNVLTRIAIFHGANGKVPIQAEWYDSFVEALMQTVASADPLARADRSASYIIQSWRSSLGPGLQYMKSFCSAERVVHESSRIATVTTLAPYAELSAPTAAGSAGER